MDDVRYAYVYKQLDGVWQNLQVYLGPVLWKEGDPQPPYSSPWPPADISIPGYITYFDQGWTQGPDFNAVTLEQLQSVMIKQDGDDLNSAIHDLNAGYTSAEMQSWAQQGTEASAYLKGDLPNPPLLSALAAGRGIPVADLARSVVAKTQEYQTNYGTLLAAHQLTRDRIREAKTVNDLPPVRDVSTLQRIQMQ